MSLEHRVTPADENKSVSRQASVDAEQLVLDIHAVILINYARSHHIASYVELAKRVRKLTILSSVDMEPDRHWNPDWQGLDIRLQKNWMFKTLWRHPTGFNELNYIHIPIDTRAQLKALQPDVVFSYEMGVRTLLSSWFQRKYPAVPLVMVGNMAYGIEKERGVFRRALRNYLCKHVQHFTYNGPSCRKYLERLKIPASKMFHLPYCIDPSKVFYGDREIPAYTTRKLLFAGSVSERKGILEFTRRLRQWCQTNQNMGVELSIAGSGRLESQVAELATENLVINLLGECDTDALRAAYGAADFCVFPSLADEWGMVPIEAMASGLPVLGSELAQSVETAVRHNVNGWSYDPTDSIATIKAIDSAMSCDPERLFKMGVEARNSVRDIKPEATAKKFCEIIGAVCSLDHGGQNV